MTNGVSLGAGRTSSVQWEMNTLISQSWRCTCFDICCNSSGGFEFLQKQILTSCPCCLSYCANTEWSLLLQGHEEEDRSLGERLNRLLARDTRNNLIWDGKLQN